MPKSLTSLDAHVADIAEARRTTGAARFKPIPPGTERVEDVLKQSIEHLSRHFVTLGFKPAVSKLTLSRRMGPVTQVLALSPDSGNLSGVSVCVSVNALVKSAGFKRWRAEHGTGYASEYLWVKQLGYLNGSWAYLKWELVNPGRRAEELDDMTSRINALAMPVFADWSDKDGICNALHQRTLIERIDWMLEVALWCGAADVARLLVTEHLRRFPDDRQAFDAEVLRFRGDPTLRTPPDAPISRAAFLAVRHGFSS